MGCTSSNAVKVAEIEQEPEHAEFDFQDEYARGKLLGKGSFGVVLATTRRSTGWTGAAKVVGLTSYNEKQGKEYVDKDRKRMIKNEITAWKEVSHHSNVVQLHRHFVSKGCAYMIMERCQCSLLEKLSKQPMWAKDAMPRILRSMLMGLQACHQAGFIHRDIKTENFLVGSDGHTMKLCDFGFATRLRSGGVRGETGTAPMMSPEMLFGEAYGTSTDMWSFGAMTYLILFKELPYVPKVMTPRGAKEATRAGVPAPRWLEKAGPEDKAAAHFVSTLLVRDASIRNDVEEALSHPLLSDVFPQKKALLRETGSGCSESTCQPTDNLDESRTSDLMLVEAP